MNAKALEQLRITRMVAQIRRKPKPDPVSQAVKDGGIEHLRRLLRAKGILKDKP
jgi:hypothetical protein